ncbi:hypothetical protein PROFUN_16387 [Planoprotostelium fungivorum]|uniref:Uncharacterized protein n=1 Tax=Planoprotostelium fungivorum TaxID=1890364 RepID=A0A2P6MNP9_9EUKA|nr:hypothetical protein PROFUN_16387 [Planoprotostelium fungivorum]
MIEEKEKEYKAEMKRVQIECKNKTDGRPEKRHDLLNMEQQRCNKSGDNLDESQQLQSAVCRCKFQKQKYLRNSPASPDTLAERIWR